MRPERYLPRLRSHLHVTDDGVLVDPLPDRDVQLSAVGRRLAAVLDGQHELGEILEGLVAAGFARADAETSFRWLLLVHAVEGAGDTTAGQVDAIARGQRRLPIIVLDKSRFQCQGSGACCQNYLFGPIYDDDAARLESLDLATAFPDLAPPYVITGERGIRHLRSVDEQCIFLEGGHRCRIHARFGAAAKPRICQLYPIETHATIAGLRVADKGSCARFATSSRTGEHMVDDLERVKSLLAEVPFDLHHPIVTIDGIPCDYGIALDFGKTAMALVKANVGTAGTTLAAIGDGLYRLRAALARCPLEPGQPDRAVAETLASSASWGMAPGNQDERIGAVALAGLIESIRAAIADEPTAAWRPDLPIVGEIVRLLAFTAEGARAAAAGIAPVRADDPDIDDVLRLSLRQQLFGQRAVIGLRVAVGLMRIALIQVLAVWGARLAAHEEGRPAIRTEDLSRGHMLAIRLLELSSVERALVQLEPMWRALLAGLPRVLALDYLRPIP